MDDDSNKVTGEWYEVDDVIFDPSGKRTERVDFAPANTLKQIMMSPSDLQDLQHGYPFVLTIAEVPKYDIKYVGRQKVDDLECYVFDVSPKTIEKGQRYLDGRIWVDATDLQIVVTNGRMVPDDTRKNSEDLHAPFMTWRQQIDGNYWFPVYTKGEGILHFSGGYGYMRRTCTSAKQSNTPTTRNLDHRARFSTTGKRLRTTRKLRRLHPTAHLDRSTRRIRWHWQNVCHRERLSDPECDGIARWMIY